jgi:tetratricopeptide (TPR) repeat protein
MRTIALKRIFLLSFAFICVSAKAQTIKDAMKFMDNEQFDKAATTLKKLIAGDPNNGDNYFWMGENYFKTDEQDSAKMFYDMGLKKNPSNALCMVGVGKILYLQDKSDDAKKMFYSAGVILADKTSKMSNEQKALVCLKIAEAYILGYKTDLGDAINQINKAATYDQKNFMVKILMGDALYLKNPGNASDAISEYKKAAEMDKNSPIPSFKKGELYLQAKNPEAAQTELDQALKIDSMFAPAYRLRAEAYYYRNQLDNGITAYKKYISINNGNCNARVRYASFLYLAKKYPDCIAECQELKKGECGSANLLNRLLGYCLYETGDYAGAMAALDVFLGKQPDNKILASDYEYYARAMQKTGKDSVAVTWYNKALMKDSARTDLLTETANIYKKLKKYPEAILAYKTKIARGGKNVTINDTYFLGQCYFYNKEYGKADTAFMKYCEVQKDIYLGYYWRGRCNSAMDPDSKTWQAKPFYETAILKSKPEDKKTDLEECYFYMGYYYFSQKDYPSAKCCYLKIKELNVANSEKLKSAQKALDGPELKNVTAAPTCIKQ